jgi:hypothetical protein
MSERETLVELPWAADRCPCVDKLRTLLPLTVGTRDGAVHLVSTLSSVVISARAALVNVCAFALVRLCACGFLSVATVLARRAVVRLVAA